MTLDDVFKFIVKVLRWPQTINNNSKKEATENDDSQFTKKSKNKSNPVSSSSCGSSEYFVSSHPRSGYVTSSGHHVSPTVVRAHCRSKSHDFWHSKILNARPPNWPRSSEKERTWKQDEKNHLFKALSLMPDELLNLDNITFHRLDKDTILKNNPAYSYTFSDRDQKYIILYDDAFLYTHNETSHASDQNNHSIEHPSLAQIIAHELAHTLYDNMSQLDRESFQRATNWIQEEPRAKPIKKDKRFIKPDSNKGPDEDLANHVEWYLFKNKLLKSKSPKGFDWIRNTYGPHFKVQGDE